MRIGIVCPYSWDIPGGVQAHVRDLAEQMIRLGHSVSVLAPGDDDMPGMLIVPPPIGTGAPGEAAFRGPSIIPSSDPIRRSPARRSGSSRASPWGCCARPTDVR